MSFSIDEPAYEKTFSRLIVETVTKLTEQREFLMTQACDRLFCQGVEHAQLRIQSGPEPHEEGIQVDGVLVWRSWTQFQPELRLIKLYEQWMPAGFKYLR